jgi:phosphohistidine phosphatase
MRLYVMRHGPAEDESRTGRDRDRALTPKGRDRVRKVAELLLREGELPGSVHPSGLVRADETAEIVVAALKASGWSGPMERAPEMAPSGRGVELIRRLRSEGALAPMVVGHEPDLTALVEQLLGGGMPIPFDKAMVVALDLGERNATLRFIVEPREATISHDQR